ncbi:hypothetical protein MTO96_020912 [Rhipicephalus appendiculatus]
MPTDLSMAGPSMSSGVQHGYQLRSPIPPLPNAFMLFAQKNRRSAAADNTRENNQRVSSRLGKLWRCLSAATEEGSCERNVNQAATDHRTKCVTTSPIRVRLAGIRSRRERPMVRAASSRMTVPVRSSSSATTPRPQPRVEAPRRSSSNYIRFPRHCRPQRNERPASYLQPPCRLLNYNVVPF